jgi:hypothetical protein
MSKKKKTYLLIAAVVAVWGTIGYKLYSKSNPDRIKKDITSTVDFKRVQTKKHSEIKITPNYRDPFLGKAYKKKTTSVVKTKAPVKAPVEFPKIAFLGFIEGKTTAYIIQIHHLQEVFKIGETKQGITLKNANDQEIVIQYLGAFKSFPLKK